MQRVSVGSRMFVLAVWKAASPPQQRSSGGLPWLDGDNVGIWEFLLYCERR